uniref:WD_REPEATS_REGION domain-containing protein n=1 Tax=Heterorhabditis bacteriophora TaxID=37862 RepID=A0A1I7XNU9_HETBA
MFIVMSCRVHPGSVRQLAACPTDPARLLISYDKGIVVQWNLNTKDVDRFPLDPPWHNYSWHYDGRQVMTGNVDGSICIYNIKKQENHNKSLHLTVKVRVAQFL